MKGQRYVEVPADDIYGVLKFAGFKRIANVGREVVYERRHHVNPAYSVKCYTSVEEGGKTARAKGEDAIRIVAVLMVNQAISGPNVGCAVWSWKAPKVLRTGSPEEVCVRLYLRLREAYRQINARVPGPPKPRRTGMTRDERAVTAAEAREVRKGKRQQERRARS